MAEPLDAELCIVGAGCAGLSLAAQLAAQGADCGSRRGEAPKRVVLIDPRTSFPRDRTWCYWDVGGPHLFSDCVTASWRRWEVREGGSSVLRGSAEHPYRHIQSDLFYRAALAMIATVPTIELRLGEAVVDVVEGEECVVVTTSRGALRAGLVLDSRPLAPSPSPHVVALLQHFRGEHVRVGRPVFDPSTATLMDFDVTQEHGLQFLYLLPFDAENALVEATFFSSAVLHPEVYETSIRSYLAGRFGVTSWETLGREAGAIPMTTAPAPSASRRIVPIGLRGGLGKPSTGYAFLAITRQSAAYAHSLLAWDMDPQTRPLPAAPRSAAIDALDRSFLSLLANKPARGPALFRDIFEGVAAESVLRFLSDCPSPADVLRVMAAAPPLTMAGEVLRAHWHWMRARS